MNCGLNVVDSRRAVPFSSMLSVATSRTKRRATSSSCAPAIAAAASTSHAASLAPTASTSSGPSAAAVRLNCSSVNRVFHAGRDGTR